MYVPVVVDNYANETYDTINTAIAVQALKTLNETSNGAFKITEEAIETATKKRPMCRFEEFTMKNSRGEDIQVILDVCHNQPGFEAMYATMKKTFPNADLHVL